MRTRHAALILFALGSSLLAFAARSDRSDGEDSMATTAPVDSNRPAIDRRTPDKLETATFALG
jgi:hypothetical protein